MRMDAIKIGLAIVLLALLGCHSYEMRRQELDRRMRGRGSELPSPPLVVANPPQASTTPPVVNPPAAPITPVINTPISNPPNNTTPVSLPPSGEEPAEAAQAAGDKLPQLYQKAVQRFAGMDSYIARLRRIEEVNGKIQPEEMILFKFRKEPWSIYFKWLGQEGKGREAAYVKGQHDGLLHTRLAAGDVLLMPAGKVMSLAPDSPLVRMNSRHPITQAGIGALIERFGVLVRQYPNAISYQGTVQKPPHPNALDEVLQSIPPGFDEQMPKGGSRRWYFDTQSGLPVMIMTWDANRRLVEHYAYDQIMYPVKLDDDDFNPSVLWKKKD